MNIRPTVIKIYPNAIKISIFLVQTPPFGPSPLIKLLTTKSTRITPYPRQKLKNVKQSLNKKNGHP